jgi:uncharacterized protein involved in exopolysaccharide biosynthesis
MTREIEGLTRLIEGQPAEIEVGGRVSSNPARTRALDAIAEARTSQQEHEGRLAALEAERDANAAALARVAALAPGLATLQRKAEVQRDQVAMFDARLRDSLADEAQGRGSVDSVRVLETATPPIGAVGAPKAVRLIAALLFGGIVGFAAGMLSHFANPTVLTAKMLERRLRAPVLAEIEWRRRNRGAPHFTG